MKKLLFISLLALTACGGGSAETSLPKDIVSPIINGGEITPTTPDTPADPSSQGGNENNGSTIATEYVPDERNAYGVSVGYLFASRFNVDLSYAKSFIMVVVRKLQTFMFMR